jgi:hypothetical protein
LIAHQNFRGEASQAKTRILKAIQIQENLLEKNEDLLKSETSKEKTVYSQEIQKALAADEEILAK